MQFDILPDGDLRFQEIIERSFEERRIRIYRSYCETFTIIQPLRETPLDEANAAEKWYLRGTKQFVVREMRMINLDSVDTFQQALEVCAEHLELRKKVWHYFDERARHEQAGDERLLSSPAAMQASCSYSVDRAKDKAGLSIEQRTAELYDYLKYRGLSTIGSGTLRGWWLDPALNRDWNAMLDGTYVQWWKQHARAV